MGPLRAEQVSLQGKVGPEELLGAPMQEPPLPSWACGQAPLDSQPGLALGFSATGGREASSSQLYPSPHPGLVFKEREGLSHRHALPSGLHSGQFCRAIPELHQGPAEAVAVTASEPNNSQPSLPQVRVPYTFHKLPAHKPTSQALSPAGLACEAG